MEDRKFYPMLCFMGFLEISFFEPTHDPQKEKDCGERGHTPLRQRI